MNHSIIVQLPKVNISFSTPCRIVESFTMFEKNADKWFLFLNVLRQDLCKFPLLNAIIEGRGTSETR